MPQECLFHESLWRRASFQRHCPELVLKSLCWLPPKQVASIRENSPLPDFQMLGQRGARVSSRWSSRHRSGDGKVSKSTTGNSLIKYDIIRYARMYIGGEVNGPPSTRSICPAYGII
jgi:hypothetical protein